MFLINIKLKLQFINNQVEHDKIINELLINIWLCYIFFFLLVIFLNNFYYKVKKEKRKKKK